MLEYAKPSALVRQVPSAPNHRVPATSEVDLVTLQSWQIPLPAERQLTSRSAVSKAALPGTLASPGFVIDAWSKSPRSAFSA